MYDHGVLRNGCLLLLWLVAGAIGTTTITSTHDHEASLTSASAAPTTGSSVNSTSVAVSLTASTGTCPSGTVNYITHTLAQQCLRIGRIPSNRTQVSLQDSSPLPPSGETLLISGSDGLATQIVLHTSNVTLESTTTITAIHSDGHVSSSAAESTPTVAVVVESTPIPTGEDPESPFDNADFLSFEQWKRQNLAKAGQSPEDVGRDQPANPNRHRPINNALEGMGEEHEIDLDFTGFGGAAQVSAPERTSTASGTTQATEQAGNSPSVRSKDAGKTCKERTNYASFDCAATILKSNKECKSAASVLVENKDSYMLNTCSAKNKFFIVELCNDIQIDTIVLANYEFFSSSFRHFKLCVSDRYPVKEEKWRELGTFEGRNTRDIQAFLIENPLIWARYLRLEFLTHYGTEYYCPVSLLRVHGTTMMEDYRHQEELARGEVDDLEEATLEAEVIATPPIPQEPIEVSVEMKPTLEAIPSVDFGKTESQQAEAPASASTNSTDTASMHMPTEESVTSQDNSTLPRQVGLYEPHNANMTCDQPTPSDGEGGHSSPVFESQGASTKSAAPTTKAVTEISTNLTSSAVPAQNPSTTVAEIPEVQTGSLPDDNQTQTAVSTSSNITFSATNASSTNAVVDTAASNQSAPSSSSSRTVAASSPPPPQPSTQESFFKSVHKRLLQLESNSTLSLQYIEEQSRILRDAFTKVEKRQIGTTSNFLSQLNETVMTELHGFRQAYDQLWQSTVIELEGQRETYQKEMIALSSRLTMVADELVWQKRMGIVQSTILLLCLALVLFGRGGQHYLEMPLMQHMLNKSSTALHELTSSPPYSPSPESRSPVSLFRRRIWRSSTDPAYRQDHRDDSDLSRPQTRDGTVPDTARKISLSVEPPSPVAATSGIATPTSEWEDDVDGKASPELDRMPTNGSSAASSSGRRRKKQSKNKSQGLSLSGGHGAESIRPKSPLGSSSMSR